MHAYLATVLKNPDSLTVKTGGTSDDVHILVRLWKHCAWAEMVEWFAFQGSVPGAAARLTLGVAQG